MHDVKKQIKESFCEKLLLLLSQKFIDGLEGIGTASFILK